MKEREGQNRDSDPFGIGALRDAPDRRAEVPDIPLLDSQRVVAIEHHNLPRQGPSSAIEAIVRLAGVDNPARIGENGPAMAARANDPSRPELRLYEATFGRDALRLGRKRYHRYPKLLETTVVKLAELQGVTHEEESEQEPGRIIHWDPDPESPNARAVAETNGWKFPHYGSIDATPSFISAIATLAQDDPTILRREYSTRDNAQVPLEHALKQAITWLEDRLEANAEGFLEWQMQQEYGISNQAWKDTPESYVHADGTYPNHRAGIASIEVQALAYDALLDAAELYETRLSTGDNATAKQLRQKAAKLHSSTMQHFWVEDDRGGYFAIGTDRDLHGNPRPMAVRSSNMGWLLNSRFLEADDLETIRRRDATIQTLFSDEMLSKFGIRTLSNKEVRYVPGSYHCGGVWPFDTREISEGLARHGFYGLAFELDKRTLCFEYSQSGFWELGHGENDLPIISRTVKVFESNPTRDHYSNIYTIEKLPQQNQAWTVEAILAIREQWTLGPNGLHAKVPLEADDPTKRRLEQEILALCGETPFRPLSS